MRRYQMFLSSKTVQTGKKKSDTGGPINVYLVQPHVADDSTQESDNVAAAAGATAGGGFVHEAPDTRGTEDHGPASRSHVTPASGEQRQGEYAYGQLPYRGRDLSGRASYPSLEPQQKRPHVTPAERTYPPAEGAGHYQDPAWGAPPHPGYGQHSNYPPSQARPGAMKPPSSSSQESDSDKKMAATDSFQSPHRGSKRGSLEQRSTPDRAGAGEPMYMDSREFTEFPPTPVVPSYAVGPASPPWSRSPAYYPAYDAGRSGQRGPPTPVASGSFGGGRPPTPQTMQHELYTMPLQSPNSRGFLSSGFFPSPSVPFGFSPAGQGSAWMRSDVHFPMPTLQGDNRSAGAGELPRWQRGAPRNLPDPEDLEPDEGPQNSPRPPPRT